MSQGLLGLQSDAVLAMRAGVPMHYLRRIMDDIERVKTTFQQIQPGIREGDPALDATRDAFSTIARFANRLSRGNA